MVAYPALADARAALAAHETPMILGAFPFDVSQPAALFRPGHVRRTGALPEWPTRTMPAVRITETVPDPAEHRARIVTALEQLRNPASPLSKVVLARAVHLLADSPLDVGMVVRRLAEDGSATAYFVDLSAAGGRHVGTALLGASPELLVARRGEVVTCQPFAGSAPRSTDPVIDRANGAALADSAKDLHEHRLVVEQMRAALQPLCTDLDIAPTPELSRTAAVWHLNTPITGRLREESFTALDLAMALHPTAAVGGVPTADAVRLISDVEGDRGFYAGAVGWCDDHGDGTWVVSIRCAELSADRRTAQARSGGGIVAESNPDDEVAETNTKFRTILSALGVST
ncbi:isochorismate synthase [Mycobacterium sp. NPDC006124]|uniref:isochorismate synthase n=1 Tax=Mycobacterium sp. NPDC006124 TaxID=3156729 RepID=UPI0033B6EAE2